jgi:hypothetical protein
VKDLLVTSGLTGNKLIICSLIADATLAAWCSGQKLIGSKEKLALQDIN